MKKILLDTSVIIDFLRRKDRENSLLINTYGNDLYISIITHTELYGGRSVWEKDEAREKLEEFLSGITALPLIPEISKEAGKLKAYNPNRTFLDCIIAATAIFHKLELTTLNVKDFRDTKGLKLFKK